MALGISRSQRLIMVIGISSCFFLTEISIGLYTHSLALVADAFHYLTDLIGFVVALLALKLSEIDDPPKILAFGWQRAPLLGAFFNGALLFALGISILLQAVERFISLHNSCSLLDALAWVSISSVLLFFTAGLSFWMRSLVANVKALEESSHAHRHALDASTDSSIRTDDEGSIRLPPKRTGSSCRDVGMLGVLLHVIGDAVNNLGVMIAALVIWFTEYEGRYYADPGASLWIAFIIILSSLPLLRKTGSILLGCAPSGIDLNDLRSDLEKIQGVLSIHEINVWHISQHKSLAVIGVLVTDQHVPGFTKLTSMVNECCQKYGIQSVALRQMLRSQELSLAVVDRI
ncbi:putative di-, tri-valent inorganic cation transporter [Aspergillus fischeri NRRL 181]|uniref:Di-, tri-valent inorganic cation transporter, putative n=1 Tax=Neosartorya fischeri (strain ATCC 1020 / DSM 3700 / CBS 544.65 / FGSC A1164 / JCM 1740 / NRRL 181 / WB 181) TaxID=331117 RepID=A1D9L0_NEOFI|nr:di-, tri-valent inorganic cation transporter, putative [Aspergillus fischeri NRRL 181]EAW20491.1 di-, tri-valent inorganic cation transporter, putative [Aspergillus fischeri NRRL 181]